MPTAATAVEDSDSKLGQTHPHDFTKRLESFPITRSFIKDIVTAERFVDIGSAKYIEFFDGINREDEDRSGYLYYLAYATLFAAEGRWGLARILGERSFISSQRSGNQRISGREAAYFCAVAKRNTATSISELDDANRWLDVAERCLTIDKERRPKLRIGIWRFRVERLSISMARVYFRIYIRDEAGGQTIDDLNQLSLELDEVLSEIEDAVGGDRDLSDPNRAHEFWINKNLERRVLINLLMAGLIKKHLGEEGSKNDIERLKGYYRLLDDNINADVEPQINSTYLYNVVFLLSDALLNRNKKAMREVERQLSELSLVRYSNNAVR